MTARAAKEPALRPPLIEALTLAPEQLAVAQCTGTAGFPIEIPASHLSIICRTLDRYLAS